MQVLTINDRQKGGGAEIVSLKTHELLQQSNDITSARKLFPYDGPLEAVINGFGLVNLVFGMRLAWTIIKEPPTVVHVHNFSTRISPLPIIALKWLRSMYGFLIIHTAHDFHLVCPNTGFVRYMSGGKYESCTRCGETGKWFNVVQNNCDRRGWVVSFIRYLRHKISYDWLQIERVFDCVICPSVSLQNFIHHKYPHLITRLLRNPTFLENSDSVLENEGESSGKVLGYFGRLQPEKGVVHFIEKEYDRSGFSTFLIYGEGQDQKKIKSLIKEKGLTKSVFLMGAIPHSGIVAEMLKIDAVVLPSLCYENCPLVVCDALRMGKTVISGSPGGVSELIELVEQGKMEFLETSCYLQILIQIYHGKFSE
jgi:glycosyltransferase involved in cell wall biosynthesis